MSLEDGSGQHISCPVHNLHAVTCLQFDSDKIVTASDDSTIEIHDTKTGALRSKLQGHEGGVWDIKYNGNVLVSGSTDKTVRVWDMEKATCTHVFRGHTSTVRRIELAMPVGMETAGMETADPEAGNTTPPQPLIITGSRDATLRIWRLPLSSDEPRAEDQDENENGDDCPYLVNILRGHEHAVRDLAVHGNTLVSGSYDCTVRVWNVSTGEMRHKLEGHMSKVYCVVLDRERNRCISGAMDNLVKIWSLDSGTLLYNLDGHSSLVGLLRLDYGVLVSGSADGSLRIWDPETGNFQRELGARGSAITCFKHDRQNLISGNDRAVTVWEVQTGRLVRELLTGLDGAWQVEMDDERCVAAVIRDSQTHLEVYNLTQELRGTASVA